MDIKLFDFELPESLIALEPAYPRDSSKLLTVTKSGSMLDFSMANLPNLLKPDDVLVFNDTKVLPARLAGIRRRGDAVANITVTLHLRVSADKWQSFVKPAKRLKLGDKIEFINNDFTLNAVVLEKNSEGEVLLEFDKSGVDLDNSLWQIGEMPLPPYIASKRAQRSSDAEDYQTIYARNVGAVAAPTAGLHFTDNLLAALKAKGIAFCFVTLHVGAGTFLPVKADDITDHKMHAEWGGIDAETAQFLTEAKAAGRRIIAVGTTSLRLLESAATANNQLPAWSGLTSIFITPGYKFKIVDLLLTNFHLPRSTLFMLVAAFCGLEQAHAIYQHAIENNYRFYSYGDTSLLERADGK